MAKVKAKVSTVIGKQLPEFVREDHPYFINFLEAYYEWLETNYRLRDLENLSSADSTLDEYVEYFANQFMALMPKTMNGDRRLLLQHAKELYLAKGTPKSYELLFRLMFNEVPQQIYYPKIDMLRASDGKWDQSTIMRGYDVLGDSFDIVGQLVFQDSTGFGDLGSQARVESVIKYNVGTQLITEITLSATSIIGEFQTNQIVRGTSTVDGSQVSILLIPIVNNITVTNKGKYYDTGYPINVDEGSGIDFAAEISTVSTGSVDNIHVVDGGDGHYVGQPILFNNNNAGFGGTSSVESAIAEVSEVDYGSILLESAVRFTPLAFVTTGQEFSFKGRQYRVTSNGTLSNTGPVHTYGIYGNGSAFLKYVGEPSSNLTNENGTKTSLEQFRIYRTDANDNYNFSTPPVNNNLYGSIKAVRMINKGKHYNSLPQVFVMTDFITSIFSQANSNIVTVTTEFTHELIEGQQIIINGSVNRIVDGTFNVNSIVDSYTFTYRSSQVFGVVGTLAAPNKKQTLYADKSVNVGAQRKQGTVKLIATSNEIGAVSKAIINNFGYYYDTAKLSATAPLLVDNINGSFVVGETLSLVPQSLATELYGDGLVLENGDKLLIESQSSATGKFSSYTAATNLVKLFPASARQAILMEDGSGNLLTEEFDKFTVGSAWTPLTEKKLGDIVNYNGVVYEVITLGTTGNVAPTHIRGVQTNGGLKLMVVSGALSSARNTLVGERSGVFTKNSVLIGNTSNATARIVDSGVAGVVARIGAVGVNSGNFTNSDGKLSDGSKKLQDSFYYQDYSYVIRIGQSVKNYRDAVKKLLHPVGVALFGEVSLTNQVQALMRLMNQEKAILSNIINLNLQVQTLAMGNWEYPSNRLLIENSDRLTTIELEGGVREALRLEEIGSGYLTTEDGLIFVSEISGEEGRSLLTETGYKFIAEDQQSIYFPEHILSETYGFFRLEKDDTHAKSRNPDVRKEQWIISLEDFVPSFVDADVLKLEDALEDGDGIPLGEDNNLLMEDGGRFLKQQQLSKPAPSMRILQSEMLPPVIIPELPLNTIHLLEMSPSSFKEIVFGLQSKVNMGYSDGDLLLEDDSGKLLYEDGSGISDRQSYPNVPNDKSIANLIVEVVPGNIELDNIMLEDGNFLLVEDRYKAGVNINSTINSALAGTRTITGSAPKAQWTNELTEGMIIKEGIQFTFTQLYGFGTGVVTAVNFNLDPVTFTIELDSPLPQTRGTTDFVSLEYRAPSYKIQTDHQSQFLYRSNFSTSIMPMVNINPITGEETVEKMEVRVQSRAAFKPNGTNLSFLEQRKFGFAPYVYGTKGSISLVPGNTYVGVSWESSTEVLTKQVLNNAGKAYEVVVAGTTGVVAPTHTTGSLVNGTAELQYIGPAKLNKQYPSGFTGAWDDQYPNPNRAYWNNEGLLLESGDSLLNESNDAHLLEFMESSGDTQIKDFAHVTIYDIINRKNKKTNFAVGSYIEILKSAA